VLRKPQISAVSVRYETKLVRPVRPALSLQGRAYLVPHLCQVICRPPCLTFSRGTNCEGQAETIARLDTVLNHYELRESPDRWLRQQAISGNIGDHADTIIDAKFSPQCFNKEKGLIHCPRSMRRFERSPAQLSSFQRSRLILQKCQLLIGEGLDDPADWYTETSPFGLLDHKRCDRYIPIRAVVIESCLAQFTLAASSAELHNSPSAIGFQRPSSLFMFSMSCFASFR
jgi:hypothetical protein